MTKLSEQRFGHEDMRRKDYENMHRLNLTEDEYIGRKQNAQKAGWGLVKLMKVLPVAAMATHPVTLNAAKTSVEWVNQQLDHDRAVNPNAGTHIEVHMSVDPKQSQIVVHTPAERPSVSNEGN